VQISTPSTYPDHNASGCCNRFWKRFLGTEVEADLTREMGAEDSEKRADGYVSPGRPISNGNRQP